MSTRKDGKGYAKDTAVPATRTQGELQDMEDRGMQNVWRDPTAGWIGWVTGGVAAALLIVALVLGLPDRGFQVLQTPGPVVVLVDAPGWEAEIRTAVAIWGECAEVSTTTVPPAQAAIWVDERRVFQTGSGMEIPVRWRCAEADEDGKCPEGADLVGVDVFLPPPEDVPAEYRQSVVTHELGHVLGLAHDGYLRWRSPMHPQAQAGPEPQTLTDADCARLRARHGAIW